MQDYPPFRHSQHTLMCPAFKKALMLSEIFFLNHPMWSRDQIYGWENTGQAQHLVRWICGKEWKKTVMSPARLQLEQPIQLGFFSLQGICAASTGWKLVASFLTKWILLGKCWLTQNTALYSVCQIQWNGDWESVFFPRMKFLLKTTDRGPPQTVKNLALRVVS